ncbi:His/Gly/Thr/Pro-type tRNA ligase C-terminal domain-containing protein [Cohnella nanjingensis]|uniref:His/Gly/Thr/Pro-type tRNA ligase C-terminal domain-containing protein n=1 Tax=Cohnella nanjingensis TaxID=1387779 RepID=UPI0024837764|nr:His/Gly/Thr/Pro-type tRNA ligase C-terminal domain-containing protein [Cohnella nanjingensis]
MGIPILVDEAVARMPSGVCGANEADYHVRRAVPGRDFAVHRTGDFRNAREGDRCPRCGQGELRLGRGIEVGHVFKLGTKYSEALGAAYLDAEGRERPLLMGCYGIGVSRLLAAIVEQRHDDKGIVWPAAIAPYRAHIVPVSARDETQKRVAEALYEELARLGIEALLDDRDERAGVKFNDADLIGIPYRIVVGKQAGEGLVEYTVRADGEKRLLTVQDVIARIREAAAAT